MRSGKRWLAGVAAGALGAGLMVGLGTTTAGAAVTDTVPVAFEVEYPSYTIVTTGLDDSVTPASFPLTITAFNAEGEAIDTAYGSNRQIRLSITNPVVVPSTANVVVPEISGVGSVSGKTAVIAAGDLDGEAPLFIGLDDSITTPGTQSWAQAGASYAGTYTMAIALVNTANGSVIQGTAVPINVVQAAAAPAATINYVREVNDGIFNVITGLGVEAEAEPDPQVVLLTDSRGGPYVGRSGTSLFLTATSRGGTWTGVASTEAEQALSPGAQALAPSFLGWGTAGRSYINATVRSVSATGTVRGTGNLPVGVGATDAGFDVALTNEVSFQPDPEVALYEVPAGTTELNFGVDAEDAGVASTSTWWNAATVVLDDTGDVVDPSGGVLNLSGGSANIDASGMGTISFKANAAASAAGSAVVLQVADPPVLRSLMPASNYATVIFADPRPLLDGGLTLGKVGTEVPVAGSITTQFGQAIPGTWTVTAQPIDRQCFTTSTQLAVATADAEGAFTITIPASAASATPATEEFRLCATNGTTQVRNGVAEVIYTATGGVANLDLASTPGNIPVVGLPTNGYVDLGGNVTANSVTDPAKADVFLGCQDDTVGTIAINGGWFCTTGTMFQVTPIASPVVDVTITAPEGAWLTTRQSGQLIWSAGKRTVTVRGNGSQPVAVYATKPGTYDVTATVGSSTDTVKFVADVFPFATRQVKNTEETATMGTNATREFATTLTDVYGNPVPFGITIAFGQGSLNTPNGSIFGGGLEVETDAKGVGKAFFTANQIQGEGLAQYYTSPRWRVSGTVAPGLAAAVNMSETKVAVGSGEGGKTILIVGGRTTKGGKPTVEVDGKTTGFKVGDTVKPFVRFPGQSSYSEGTARPAIDAGNNFYWSRKTGKKTYVYFTNDDGKVRSNTVIIPAK